tara:strand:- start:10861 stop:11103 length:243 start_codon:yes stop_codon:yes gene_type:complete
LPLYYWSRVALNFRESATKNLDPFQPAGLQRNLPPSLELGYPLYESGASPTKLRENTDILTDINPDIMSVKTKNLINIIL